MKKTLIALMALAGVAAAESASTLNANLTSAISDYGYTVDGGFVLQTTLTLDGGSEKLMNFDESWYLFSQIKRYFGMTNTSDPGNWDIVGGATTNPFGDTLNVGSSSGWLTDTNTSSDTITVTLTCHALEANDSIQYNTALVVSIPSKSEPIIASQLLDAQGNNSFYFDLNNVEFLKSASSAMVQIGNSEMINLVGYVAPESPVVPEPATATLSLLALAGLAARRRRK